jgi:hypothetical protein
MSACFKSCTGSARLRFLDTRRMELSYETLGETLFFRNFRCLIIVTGNHEVIYKFYGLNQTKMCLCSFLRVLS